MSPKTFHSYYLDIMSVEFIKNIFSPIRASWWVLDSFRPPEPKNVWFLLSRHHVRRVHEKYLLADSSQLMRVRLISASWAQKRLIPTLQTSCTSNSWEIFFSPIRANWWVLDSFSPPEPKNVWFLLSRHDIRRVHEKLFSRRYERAFGCFTHFGFPSPKTFHSYFLDIMCVEFMKNIFSPIRASWWVLDSFRPPEQKNVWFQPSRHDVRRVHEKLFSRRYERAVGWFTHFGLLSPKTFDSYFIDIMYVKFVKKFFLADSSEVMGVRLISASWAQKRLIPTF